MYVPPQGVNFSCQQKFVEAPVLARALCRTVSFFQSIEARSAQLHRYEDWWEHDGYHRYVGAMNFHELFAIVESPRSLIRAMPDDDDVFISVTSASNAWYLRFYLAWDDEGFNLYGRFDVSLPVEVASAFKAQVITLLECPIIEEDASMYYKRIRV